MASRVLLSETLSKLNDFVDRLGHLSLVAGIVTGQTGDRFVKKNVVADGAGGDDEKDQNDDE